MQWGKQGTPREYKRRLGDPIQGFAERLGGAVSKRPAGAATGWVESPLPPRGESSLEVFRFLEFFGACLAQGK